MNYMVFDLEFNQKIKAKRSAINTIKPECPFEIIDIGAIKLDEELNTIATFDELIKPAIHKRLHPFIEKMTGITRESLRTAKGFHEVYDDLREFLRDVDVLCVWGTVDLKELIRNMMYHELDVSIIPNKYINVQHYASKILQAPGGSSVGLGNAAKLLNIPLEIELHKAFNDAYYTAEVFKKINSEDIEPKVYCFNEDVKHRRPELKKTTLDSNKLIAQFEKMYNREMTLEEQEIIKLAYKMGHTKQFQSDIL
jgi:DNA polymerase III epsilon subunit-like protein